MLPVTNPPGRISVLVQSDRIWIGDDRKVAAPVDFQDLVDVMTTARLAGYQRVGISDQAALSSTPVL